MRSPYCMHGYHFRFQPDMVNILLPRSTGLHYSLRSLAPRIPSLELIDITMAYPGEYLCGHRACPSYSSRSAGIPYLGYGQSYYTLRSIFCDGVPPPVVHMHSRKFNVKRNIPIGNISSSNPEILPNGSAHPAVEIEIPKAESDAFELWLRDLWREKDKLMSRFLETGYLSAAAESKSGPATVTVPVQLKHRYEILDAFGFFLPTVVGCASSK